eukprot:15459604-Alexandrium_andersonii.AAC.1
MQTLTRHPRRATVNRASALRRALVRTCARAFSADTYAEHYAEPYVGPLRGSLTRDGRDITRVYFVAH